jgi:prepilin peptidase CpaA
VGAAMAGPFNQFYALNGPALIFLGIVMSVAAYTDVTRQKIPNKLTFPAMACGILYHVIFHGYQGLFFSLTGLATGFALLILFYILGGMGAGDVKLMAAVGAVLGAKGVFAAFLFTALYGGIYSLGVILTHRPIFKGFFKNIFNTVLTFVLIQRYDPIDVSKDKDKPRLCYGIVIALGTFTYMVFFCLELDFLF